MGRPSEPLLARRTSPSGWGNSPGLLTLGLALRIGDLCSGGQGELRGHTGPFSTPALSCLSLPARHTSPSTLKGCLCLSLRPAQKAMGKSPRHCRVPGGGVLSPAPGTGHGIRSCGSAWGPGTHGWSPSSPAGQASGSPHLPFLQLLPQNPPGRWHPGKGYWAWLVTCPKCLWLPGGRVSSSRAGLFVSFSDVPGGDWA